MATLATTHIRASSAPAMALWPLPGTNTSSWTPSLSAHLPLCTHMLSGDTCSSYFTTQLKSVLFSDAVVLPIEVKQALASSVLYSNCGSACNRGCYQCAQVTTCSWLCRPCHNHECSRCESAIVAALFTGQMLLCPKASSCQHCSSCADMLPAGFSLQVVGIQRGAA